MNIQTQFKNTSGDMILSPNEYEGPLTVDRPCIVDGNGSTLWSDKGPVLVIASPGVTVRNLRVECIKDTNNTAPVIDVLYSGADAVFVNVEVNGDIAGAEGEAEGWKLPPVISLGEFEADKKNTFTINIPAAAGAQILNSANNITLFPRYLAAGDNYITVNVEEMREDNILYSEIFIKTTVLRRIYITGKAVGGIPAPPAPDYAPSQIKVPRSIAVPAVSDSPAVYVKKGQRISAEDFKGRDIRIVYEHKSLKRPVDIDAYIFLLNENEKAECDEDLIFFGNPSTSSGSVKYIGGDMPLTLVNLDKLDKSVNKAVVCYSIYGGDAGENFSLVNSPIVRIIDGENELYRFELSGLNIEKTVAAIEFYRYKGEWKINFIGSGYRKDLKQLCEDYGINVE